MTYRKINAVSTTVALRLENPIIVRKNTVAKAPPRRIGGSCVFENGGDSGCAWCESEMWVIP
jgi:hypothetical protein